MKVSYLWLQSYFEKKLPSPEKLADVLTMHSFEVEETIKKGNDFVFEIDVLPNRAHDCLSHEGVAKEISVLFGLEPKKDLLSKTVGLEPWSNELTVKVDDEDSCFRYSACVIKNVIVAPAPCSGARLA